MDEPGAGYSFRNAIGSRRAVGRKECRRERDRREECRNARERQEHRARRPRRAAGSSAREKARAGDARCEADGSPDHAVAERHDGTAAHANEEYRR